MLYENSLLNFCRNNLDPKYINIEHKILYGESFNSILENYEIPKDEINTIKKLLSKKENLNKLKQNQIIKFTLDLGDSKKIINIVYPIWIYHRITPILSGKRISLVTWTIGDKI